MRSLLVALLLALVLAAPATAAENTQWLSYGHDNQLTNAITSKALTAASVRRLDTSWVTRLDGTIYASPLATMVDGREVVFAATERGSVYALAANDGRVLWHQTLGTVVTPGCGTYGITSTGAIDTKRGLLYVISADGELNAFALSSGLEPPGFPLTIVTNTLYEYVWGGLRIAHDRLYVGVASYCDEGPEGDQFPDGRLVAIPLANPGAATAWEPVPGPGNLGGIWGWGGVSVDPATGDVYTGIGNSHSFSAACSCDVDDAGYGDQMVELSPDLSSVLGSDSVELPVTGDYDFGAAPLLFQPKGCPPLAAANNKIGSLYIWNRTDLGAGPIASIPLGDGLAAFIGSPSWSEANQTIYDAEAVLFGGGKRLGNGVQALKVEPGCTFRKTWAVPVGDGNQATPLVVGDVVFATGGKPGGFAAFGAANGAHLWAAPTAGRTVAAMISVGGAVIGADTDGLVYAFRPPAAPPRSPPSPPTSWRRLG
ncbi:MAG TPA: PQQ-binding-like beta-propeller repeat protein [Gaiellaceae bacterium]|nr:PQQ-binding-like beta-propeller repeat protein [Gaiellaceae bacterium]